MAGVKLVVMYPRPKDIDAFEKLYQKNMFPWPSRSWRAKPSLWRPR